MKIAGLDIGTTTISGVLVDTQTKSCIEVLTRPNSSQISAGEPWENLQDPLCILETCREILSHFAKKFGKYDALGLTGQMHGILYVDVQGQAVSPLFTWQDGRGDLEYCNGTSYAEHLATTTGYPMATGFGLTTHFFNLKNDLVPADAKSLCTIADYIAGHLCGRRFPVMHASLAHSLGLFELERGGFDVSALQGAGINRGFLPAVSTEEIQVGETKAGIPVCIPIGDNQASFLGAVEPGSNLLINIGTGSQISVLSEEISILPPLETRPFVRGEYLLVGAGLTGGSAYSLLRDFFARTLRQLGGVEVEGLYAKMQALGECVYPRSNPLVMDTRFRGSRADPHHRGAIRNLGRDNFTPGALIVGVLHGMVDDLKAYYDLLPEDMKGQGFITGSGNAIRRNALLRKIIADRFGMELRLPANQGDAAVGAALLAGTTLLNFDEDSRD